MCPMDPKPITTTATTTATTTITTTTTTTTTNTTTTTTTKADEAALKQPNTEITEDEATASAA